MGSNAAGLASWEAPCVMAIDFGLLHEEILVEGLDSAKSVVDGGCDFDVDCSGG